MFRSFTSILTVIMISAGIAGARSNTSELTDPHAGSQSPMPASASEEFDRLRNEGNDALYNIDYQTARDRYQRMTKVAPDHPAGYVYLANNLWLEWLNSSRRLSSSLYSGGSFYVQGSGEDKIDPKLESKFNDLIKQALAVTTSRLQKDPKDVEALYYQAAAFGLRAGFKATVKRSFVRAIGDANDSIKLQKQVIKLDPNYVDAYLSIGLYEYIVDSLPFLWRTLARIAGFSGSKKRGIEHLEMAAEKGKYTPDDARVLLIGVYSREGRPDLALEMISYLSAKYPRNYLLGVERAAMLYRSGRQDEGARVFADLLKDSRVAQSAADHVHYHWGGALETAREYAAAVERYKEVIRWPKSDSDLIALAHLHAGQALDAMGKRDLAMAEYEAVLKLANVFDSHKLAAQYVKKPYVPAKG